MRNIPLQDVLIFAAGILLGILWVRIPAPLQSRQVMVCEAPFLHRCDAVPTVKVQTTRVNPAKVADMPALPQPDTKAESVSVAE